MKLRTTLILACTGAGLLLGIGCMSVARMAPEVNEELAAMGQSQGHAPDALLRGRRTYLVDCARCHTIEPIDRYSEQEWKATLPEMSKESDLKPAEEAELTGYILTALQYLQSQPTVRPRQTHTE